MLWDCKMRFGKTITAYSLVKNMGYKKVLVVTHRPAVVDGWRTDFSLIFQDDHVFLTKANIKEEDRFTVADASIDAENDRMLKNLADAGTPFVYFASMQDLRGSKISGGKFDKNIGVFSMDWNLITSGGTLFERNWNDQGITYILKNEKYSGDLLLQKYYTVDFLTKKVAPNNGQLPQYFVENSHEPVIAREIFQQVQAEMARRRKHW